MKCCGTSCMTLLITVLWVCLLLEWSAASGLRGQLHDLQVRVLVMDISYDTGGPNLLNDDQFECSPLFNNDRFYDCDLPDAFVQAHRPELQSGNCIISIPGGHIHGDRVVIPPDVLITVLPYDVYGSRHLQQPPNRHLQSVDRRTVLVLRVTSEDAEVELSREILSERIFSDDLVTLRSQYAACSHGQLIMEAADSSPYIINGVLDVSIPMSAQGASRGAVANAATQSALQILGGTSLGDNFDHVIYCLPPGTAGNWIAFAFLNYFVSVYNNEFCGYVSSQLHEVGHNLGLFHSNEQEQPYRDQTGIMGYTYPEVNGPLMCFNAHKHYQLGWLSSRTLDIADPRNGQVIQLGAYVDFDIMRSGEYAILNIFDLVFVQFNRAKTFNIGTKEYADCVTIVTPKADGSDLLAAIGDNEEFRHVFVNDPTSHDASAEIEDFVLSFPGGATQYELILYVCRIDSGSPSRADVVWLSVGFDGTFCHLIPEVQNAANGAAFSLSEDEPSDSPSYFPSAAPSDQPSSFPSESSGTSEPTSSPTLTAPPTIYIPDDGSLCDDSPEERFFVNDEIGNERCYWLYKNMDEWGSALCVPGHDAYELCPETCGRCFDICEDSNSTFVEPSGRERDCDWLASRPNKWNQLCAEGQPARDVCPETCNSCDPYDCRDSRSVFFEVASLNTTKECIWLSDSSSRRQVYRDEVCVPEHPAFHICPETCGKCRDDCEDDPNFRFDVDGASRDCQWLFLRPRYFGECGRDDVGFHCMETCAKCAQYLAHS